MCNGEEKTDETDPKGENGSEGSCTAHEDTYKKNRGEKTCNSQGEKRERENGNKTKKTREGKTY